MSARSKTPYLLRALYEWIVDSEMTPYLLVEARDETVRVPSDYVSDGKIVLNISPMAVRQLLIEDDSVSFDGRFSGRAYPVYVPIPSVLAIYAKETGEGMMFEEESSGGQAEDTPLKLDVGDDLDPDDPPPKNPGGHLKVIK